MSATEQRASFFRQSGWLMIANLTAGVMMWAVHFLNKFMPPEEYGRFGVFLAVVMLLPTMPLQMVFAQQTARANAQHREQEMSGLIQVACLVIFALWILGAALVLLFQQAILERWHMNSAAGLWVTLPVMLFAMLQPLFWGALQGQQNFLWLGWSILINGIGRVAIATVVVLALRIHSAGLMTGVLAGYLISILIPAWQTRGLWFLRAKSFDWRTVMRQVVPLTLGFLGFQILFTADTILVKAYFSETDAGFYVSAGTLSRALMWFVLPLAVVMFPRIVQSVAKSEKTNLMGMVLLATAALAIVGALGLSLLGPLVVRFVYKPEFVSVASSLLPWYAAAMVPLALANVLLNNLLARPTTTLVPALCIFGVALAYLVALTQFHDSLITVLKVLSTGNLFLLAVCAWFTWRAPAPATTAPAMN